MQTACIRDQYEAWCEGQVTLPLLQSLAFSNRSDTYSDLACRTKSDPLGYG